MHLVARQAATLTLVFVVEVLGRGVSATPSKDVVAHPTEGNPIFAVAARVKSKVKAANLMDEAAFPRWEKELDTAVQDMDVHDEIILELVGDMDLSSSDAAADQVVQRLMEDGVFVEMVEVPEPAAAVNAADAGPQSSSDRASAARQITERGIKGIPWPGRGRRRLCKHL